MAQAQSRALSPEPGETMIDIAKFRSTPLTTDPFDYIIVPGFVPIPASERIVKDYPSITKRGSFPLHLLTYGPAFGQILSELRSDAFRAAVAEKFSVNLESKPTVITVRGMCSRRDGRIHTDTESKILSLLLYMNPGWDEHEGGRLRLLRSNNIEDVAAEVPPAAGTLLIFRRTENSFHGHKMHVGARKVIQMNWVTDQRFVDNSATRHGFSAFIKKLNPFSGEY